MLVSKLSYKLRALVTPPLIDPTDMPNTHQRKMQGRILILADDYYWKGSERGQNVFANCHSGFMIFLDPTQSGRTTISFNHQELLDVGAVLSHDKTLERQESVGQDGVLEGSQALVA